MQDGEIMIGKDLHEEIAKRSPHRPVFVYDPGTYQFYKLGEVFEGSFFTAITLDDALCDIEMSDYIAEHIKQEKLSNFREGKPDDHRVAGGEQPHV